MPRSRAFRQNPFLSERTDRRSLGGGARCGSPGSMAVARGNRVGQGPALYGSSDAFRVQRMRLAGGHILKFPAVMGVLNVTPDSFSDGGLFLDPKRAVDHALEMQDAGAYIIDIGGESTRPVGAREVSAGDELRRLVPVFRALQAKLRVPVSVDTRKAVVARAALEFGASIINDVTALRDPEMATLAARSGCAVVLMHIRGTPVDHMKFARYRNVVAEIMKYLAERAAF